MFDQEALVNEFDYNRNYIINYDMYKDYDRDYKLPDILAWAGFWSGCWLLGPSGQAARYRASDFLIHVFSPMSFHLRNSMGFHGLPWSAIMELHDPALDLLDIHRLVYGILWQSKA